jgi:magnesium transporter
MDADRLLSRAFLAAHPAEAAEVLERLPPRAAVAVLDDVAAASAALVLQRMAPGAAVACLVALDVARAAPIVAHLPVHTGAALLRRIDPAHRAALLPRLQPAEARAMETLLNQLDGTAGAIMDPHALALPEDLTARDARRRVRRSADHARAYLYVVRRDQTLAGVLGLRELLATPASTTLAAAMHGDVRSLAADADEASVVSHPGWRRFHTLPVVDDRGVYLGAVRYETMRAAETRLATREPAARTLAAVLSAAELYWIGLAGLLVGLAAPLGARGDDHGV